MTTEQWNKKHVEGTPVRYFPIMGYMKEYLDSVTRSEAWDICGTPCVLIAGKSGGVALSHLVILPAKQ
jgi:hypothetical protein